MFKALVAVLLAGLVLPGVVIGCTQPEGTVGGNMVSEAPLPLIDTVPEPQVTETATFGLG